MSRIFLNQLEFMIVSNEKLTRILFQDTTECYVEKVDSDSNHLGMEITYRKEICYQMSKTTQCFTR